MKISAVSIWVFLFLTMPCFSEVIRIPADYPTIQAGIDAAINDDVILVAPGTYEENINFRDISICICSEKGPDETLIKGVSSGPVVYMGAVQLESSMLDGFTITNGMQGASRSHGGGIHCKDSAIIRNNIIENNDGWFGGGIHCTMDCVAIVYNNIIRNNTAEYSAGIDCDWDSSPVISNNLICYNMSVSSGTGIGSGGIGCFRSSPLIINNTIVENSAPSGSTSGGAIYCQNDSHPQIRNTIIWGNEAASGNEIYINFNTVGSSVDIRYSNVKGGKDTVYVEPGNTLLWGPGNIDVDPLFAAPGIADYHLTSGSPCRDAGYNGYVADLEYDFEYDPRIAFGTVDIGMDEFHGHLYWTGDFTPSGSVEGRFVGLPATWPVGLFIGSGVMDPPMSHMWGDFYLESPWYLYPLVPIPVEGILVFPASLPATPAPYDIPMQALIGWELSNLFVLKVR